MIDQSGGQPQRDSWQFLDHPEWILQAWFGPFLTFLSFNVENAFIFVEFPDLTCTALRPYSSVVHSNVQAPESRDPRAEHRFIDTKFSSTLKYM